MSTAESESPLQHDKIDKFISILRQSGVIPNARYKSAGGLGSAEAEIWNYANVELADTFDIYRGSRYYHKGNNKFIHYTSIQNAINIIQSKKLRLFDLHCMDDKLEFSNSYKMLEKQNIDYLVSEIKKSIFCFSMCDNDLEDSENSLTCWRQYGMDGNGVALVLDFNKKFQRNWVHLMLSKVFYEEKDLKNISSLLTSYKNFKVEDNFNVSNMEESLYKTFAFHKHKLYKDEREVRLIYYQGHKHYEKPKTSATINKANKKSSFIELDLEFDPLKFKGEDIYIHMKKIRPYIEVKKIIFGYRVPKETQFEVVNILIESLDEYINKPTFGETILKKYFSV